MSNLVRAGILALAMVHDSSMVRAITLRTLLENQITAGTALQADADLRFQEAAVLNIARDIQELSFAQIQQETGETNENEQSGAESDPYDVEQGFVELAKQLVELSGTGKLGTLKECLIDVANGTYETSRAAKLAAGTLELALDDDGMQQVEVLVKKSDGLLQPGESITAMDGETVAVEPIATDDQTEDQTIPVVPTVDENENIDEVEGESESEEVEANDDENLEGEQGADSDNNDQQDGAETEEDEELEMTDTEGDATTDGTTDDTTNTNDQEEPAPQPEDDAPDDDQAWFYNWM